MKRKQFTWYRAITAVTATLLAISLIEVVAAQGRATGRGRTRPKSRLTPELVEQIIRIAREEGVDPMLALELMRVESNFNQLARSPKGAMGLMQMIPATALRFGVIDPYDPEQAIRGGCRYLKFLSARYSGLLELVLAAYNAGKGAVDKYGRRIPPYQETRMYVSAVMRGYRRAKQIEESVLRRERAPGSGLREVTARRVSPLPRRATRTDAQVRTRLEALGRIPSLGRISDMEAQQW